VITPQVLASSPQSTQLQELAARANCTVPQLTLALGVVFLVPGIPYLILGVLVRKGGQVRVVLSIVLNSLFVLLFLAKIVVAMIGMAPAELIISLIPFGLSASALVLLFEANRNAPLISAMKNQYAAQYLQHLQYQQAYQQGQGYGAPPGAYGAPQQGYGMPGGGGYGVPPGGYGAPPAGYGAQSPGGYGAPPTGYGAQPTGYGQLPPGPALAQPPRESAPMQPPPDQQNPGDPPANA
jgi:hypothetical protein